MSERHQVQFPEDIEVFYIAPPALDEFRRWLQNWIAEQQSAAIHVDDSDLETEDSGSQETQESSS